MNTGIQEYICQSLVEGCSDHLLAGEHLPGSGVSGAGAEPGVDGRVPDVLVAQPVLGEVDVSTGVQDVRADGW